MPFKDPKERAAFFAKQKMMNPLGNPATPNVAMVPSNTAPPQVTPGIPKIPGLPRTPKFGRIRKMFKV